MQIHPGKLLAFICLIAGFGHAAEPSNGEGWQPIFLQMAEEYVIGSIEEPRRTFELRKSPVLRWSQPVRGGDDGATFVWMDHGRPAAIGTIFAYPNADQTRTVVHEFHSLAREPLKAVWRTRTIGEPATAGISFLPIAGAPEPADKPAARMAQMRSILREFSARSIDSKEQPWELRLMTQPLVRYETDSGELALDGAVFAFAQGTDPEILFVIEAQRDQKGVQWKFGCGRFSDYQLELKHKDKTVWQVDKWDFSTQNNAYFASSVEKRKAPEGATSLKDRKSIDP